MMEHVPNGIQFFISSLLTNDLRSSTRVFWISRHARPPFANPFIAIGTMGMTTGRLGARCLVRGEPVQGIDEADPVDGDVCAGRLVRLPGAPDRKSERNHQFFEHTVNRLAFEHVEAHGGFQMGIIRFNAPPGKVEL